MLRTGGLVALAAAATVVLFTSCGSRHASKSPFLVPSGDLNVLGDTYGNMISKLTSDGSNEPKILARATPGQRIVYVISFVDQEIQYGGYYQVFWNLKASFVEQAIRDADQIGARRWAALLREAEATLLPANRPDDVTSQRKLLGCPEYCDHGVRDANQDWRRTELRKYLRRYVFRHSEEFFVGE